MKENFSKIITLAGLGVSVLATVFAIIFALNVEANSFWFDIAYWITFLFVVLSLVGIIGFALYSFINKFNDDRKGALKTVYILVAAVVVCLVSFLLASGTDVSEVLLQKNNLTASTSKWIGAACILVYILVGAAALAILYVELLAKFLKRK
ncbi:MAG: hypothetical protein KBT04_04050 [Bacteroidales bacterium]|nr:hypothetical protein [Candidatus Colimorpha onthohippi]